MRYTRDMSKTQTSATYWRLVIVRDTAAQGSKSTFLKSDNVMTKAEFAKYVESILCVLPDEKGQYIKYGQTYKIVPQTKA